MTLNGGAFFPKWMQAFLERMTAPLDGDILGLLEPALVHSGPAIREHTSAVQVLRGSWVPKSPLAGKMS